MTITATKTSWGYACSGASAAQVLLSKGVQPPLLIKALVSSGSSTASVFTLWDGDGQVVASGVGAGTYGAFVISPMNIRVDGLKATMVGTSYLSIICG